MRRIFSITTGKKSLKSTCPTTFPFSKHFSPPNGKAIFFNGKNTKGVLNAVCIITIDRIKGCIALEAG